MRARLVGTNDGSWGHPRHPMSHGQPLVNSKEQKRGDRMLIVMCRTARRAALSGIMYDLTYDFCLTLTWPLTLTRVMPI